MQKPGYVVVDDKEHQGNQEKKADFVGYLPPFEAHRFSC
jgi:hypothetical protein